MSEKLKQQKKQSLCGFTGHCFCRRVPFSTERRCCKCGYKSLTAGELGEQIANDALRKIRKALKEI